MKTEPYQPVIRAWAQHKPRFDTFIKDHCGSIYQVMAVSTALAHRMDTLCINGRQISLVTGLFPSTVYNLVYLQRLHPDLQKLLDPPTPEEAQMSIVVGAALGRIDSAHQQNIWMQSKKELTEKKVVNCIRRLGERQEARYGGHIDALPEDKHTPTSRKVMAAVNMLKSATRCIEGCAPEEVHEYLSIVGKGNEGKFHVHLSEAEQVLQVFRGHATTSVT